MSTFLKRMVSLFYRVMMVVIIGVLLFAGKIPYNEFHKRTFWLPNYFLILIGAALVFAIYKVVSVMLSDKVKPWIVFAVMLVLSVVVAFGGMFITGWDAGTVTNDAFTLSSGGSIGGDYYSVYPNNRLILVAETELLRLGTKLGFSGKSALYGFAVMVQCLVFWLTGLLLYDYLRIRSGMKAALWGTVVYMLLIGLSPWIFIVYTDALGILFPMLVLWISVKIPDKNVWLRILKWVLVALISVVGYHVKAPTLIMFIAIVMSFAIDAASHFMEKKFLQDVLIGLMAIVVCAVLMKTSDGLVDNVFTKVSGAVCDHEKSVSAYHYLMMGHNDERDGTVNGDDLDFSMFISNYDERVERDKDRFKERIKELWPGKLIMLYGRKLTMNYNDGSFGYALSGEDFIAEELSDDSVLNSWIRFFYWPQRGGFNAGLNAVHMLWLGILAFCLLYRMERYGDYAVALGMLGATLFTVLFEAQARYLFVWAPLFIIAAVCAMPRSE